jgi:hypothetical protein
MFLSEQRATHIPYRFLQFLFRGESTAPWRLLEWTKQVMYERAWSGLYWGWANTSKLSFWKVSTVWAAACGRVLSCNNTIPYDSWIFLSICRHSVAAKHCSRIMLKVFDGFRPLINLQNHKKRIFLGANGKWRTIVNFTFATKELTEQIKTCTVVIRRNSRLTMHA